ncbi:MAG: diguanylate cyclase [Candidatus Omnitrophica bacterium]|nr:diguanylate cyclase [Candidatus Omnitrophota bacterium]MBD3269642.1 diguanylate cyclase [Candidatus Omnitrophota bacterium]
MYSILSTTALILLVILSFLFACTAKISLISFVAIIVVAGGIFVFFYRARLKFLSVLQGENERIEVEINLLEKGLKEKKETLALLPERRKRLSLLFSISQNLIELIDTSEIYDYIINTLGDLFPDSDSILFFVFEKDKDSLSLSCSLKRKEMVIKEKEGDILDKWVLRHNCSLLIDDLTRDFRFDYTHSHSYTQRKSRSFVASPISVGDKVLGVMRAESQNVSNFSLEDSRILRNICDLAAVVIERGNLLHYAKDLAIKDSLTSLFLRDYFFERLDEELKRCSERNSNLGLLMLDIDDFKMVNDQYGHVVGDSVLKKLAKILNGKAGEPGNLIARYGGEEFIIYVVECDKDKILKIGEDIRLATEEAELTFRRKKIKFTVSLGAVVSQPDERDVNKLTEKVDKALYKAKREGKNRICFAG